MSENKNIKISDLVLNTGQIEGLPKNPRFIRNERFESLKKSIQGANEKREERHTECKAQKERQKAKEKPQPNE